jgi:hypothetical protein
MLTVLNEGTTGGGGGGGEGEERRETSVGDGWSEVEYQRCLLRCWASRPSPSQETPPIVSLRALLHGREERSTSPSTTSTSSPLPFSSFLSSSWSMAVQRRIIAVDGSHSCPPFLVVDVHTLHSPLSIQLTLFLVLHFIRSTTRRLMTLEDAVDLVPFVLIPGEGRDKLSVTDQFLREVVGVEVITPFVPSSFHTPSAAAARSAIRGVEEQGKIDPAIRSRVRRATSVMITRQEMIDWMSTEDGGINEQRWSQLHMEQRTTTV